MRGSNAVNVNEVARLAPCKAIAADPTGRFRTLSTRAVKLFEEDSTPAGRIEWIYHLLCADPEIGAVALENNHREWSRAARPADRSALATALKELDESGFIQGRARLGILMVTAWTRVSRGEAAAVADVAAEILEMTRSVGDDRAEADAHAILGEVMNARGQLTEARGEFEAALAISRRLADDDPSNSASQWELASASVRVGGVLQAQGKLAEALVAFKSDLAISRGLAELDRSNPAFQTHMEAAYKRVGGVLEALGKLSEALEAFEVASEIGGRLAEQDPTSTGWQWRMVVAHTDTSPPPVHERLDSSTDHGAHAGIDQRTTGLRDQVFISYSHKDKRFLDDLQTHLKPYLRNRTFTTWSDKQIEPGSKWFDSIKSALARTSVVVMLVSPAFLASDFIADQELGPLLKEADAGGVTILWVLVRDCFLSGNSAEGLSGCRSTAG